MRWVLALSIIIGCAMCGRSLAGSSRRRASLLEGLVRGVKLLRVHMTGMFEPLAQSLSRTEVPTFDAVADAMRGGMSANDSWEAVKRREFRRGGMLDALTREDQQALDELFSRLGESGRDAQDILLDGASKRLAENLESARVRAREAEKLYGSLGLLTGLMLALIAM